MEFIYILIGVIVGVGLTLLLDVGTFADKFAKKEEKFDDKAE